MFVTCSSALEVAVRFGFTDITKMLLSYNTSALHCREYGGRTPILTAVKFNRSEIFEYLLSKGANLNDTCLHDSNLETIKSFLRIWEYSQYLEDKCKNGSSIPHLIAIHGRDNMFLTIYRNYTQSLSFWNVSFENDISLLHVSACLGNLQTLSYLREILSPELTEKTTNGSSPFHSAAVCRSRKSLNLLCRWRSDGVLFKDNEGMNLMHYVCKEPYSNGYSVQELKIVHFILEKATASDTIHFSAPDMHGNTFLHYAAESGKYNILQYCMHLYDAVIAELLNVTNKNGLNVFDVVVNQLQQSTNIINIPRNCSFTDMFLKSCNVDPSVILSPHEYFLVLLLDCNMLENVESVNMKMLWKKSFRKG